MDTKQKENVALQQSILKFPVPAKAKGDVAVPRGRKRTLTVKVNEEINLDNAHIPVTKEVVEAMRKRILELEEALEGQPATKRAKASKTPEGVPKDGPSTSTDNSAGKAKVDKKKLDAILKIFWTSLQKDIKTEKYKFRGGPPKTCKIDEVIEPEEFYALFESKLPMGALIQPRPDNKPNSSVTIISYGSKDIEELWGKHYKEIKGNRYSVGGILARFAKGEKIGLVTLDINGLEVSYAKNTMKCSLKFEVEEATAYRLGRDEDFDDSGFYRSANVGSRAYGWVLS